MEIFVDFGLFELLGLLALAGVARNPRAARKLRGALAGVRTKLGRCWRCMTGAALGVIATWAAFVWIGPHTDRLARLALLGAALAFTALGALHALVAVYRVLYRLERRVSVLAGGCGCSSRELPRPTRGSAIP